MIVRGYPAFIMIGAMLVSTFIVSAAVLLALQAPYLGLSLKPSLGENKVLIQAVDPDGPARHLADVAILRAIGDMPLNASDLAKEPDQFGSYGATAEFMARQTSLAALLRSPSVTVTGEEASGTLKQVHLAPTARSLLQIPASFWIQIGFSLLIFWMGVWVWALRPSELGIKIIVVGTLLFFLGATCVAIFNTRELAIDGATFHALWAISHLTSASVDSAALLVFLAYPRQLVRPVYFWLPLAATTLWWGVNALQVFPVLASSIHIVHLVFTVLILAAIIVQWRASSRHPVERAAILSLGTGVILSIGLFFIGYSLPLMILGAPIFSRDYLQITIIPPLVGVAIGVARYRLFELGEWAFRLAFYAVGILLLLLLDAALVFMLQAGQGLSLGLSMLVLGFGYMPLREYLWRRLVIRPRMSDEELFRRIVEVVLSASPKERAERWRRLMSVLFDPLEIQPVQDDLLEPAIRADGVELILPQTAISSALLLRYPRSGRGLFNPSHLRLATQAMALAEQADASFRAYERGVLEERQRIARDLHDDVGARLLSSMHKPDLPRTRESLRLAMNDLRLVISQLSGDQRPLGEVLADLRHETIERVEAAGLQIAWPPFDDDQTSLNYATRKNLVSATREIISNALRHARASRIDVEAIHGDGLLKVSFTDDGVGLPPQAHTGSMSGLGLQSMRQRMTEGGGELLLAPVDRGTRIVLTFPLGAAKS